MVRKKYDEYDYIDPEGLYTNRKTGVLKNKFSENDKEKLRILEYKIVSGKLLELFINPIEVHSVRDIYKIHEFLFLDIYFWAGQFRKVNISKSGKSFIPIQSFYTAENYLNDLIYDYIETASTRREVIVKLCEILDNLNYFHPFREGNGRTQREVIRVLAFMKGYEANININKSDEIYNLYMDGTVFGDKKKLERLLEKILVKL